MAQEWPDSTFVGFDLVPVQIDLATLARGYAARLAKAKLALPTGDTETGSGAEINYADIKGRVHWQLGNL